jgi:DNA-binding response OmpR family regulator
MRILLVEDEFLVASAVEAILDMHGHGVIGPVATVEAALAALDDGPAPDAAIVDLNLRGKSATPVAEELARRHIPFLFASGYELDIGLRERFPGARWLRKPYTGQQIRASLAEMERSPET